MRSSSRRVRAVRRAPTRVASAQLVTAAAQARAVAHAAAQVVASRAVAKVAEAVTVSHAEAQDARMPGHVVADAAASARVSGSRTLMIARALRP